MTAATPLAGPQPTTRPENPQALRSAMQALLSSARRLPLPLPTLRRSYGLCVHRTIALSIRQLQSAPQRLSGVVDFIGFDGSEYIVEEPSADDPTHVQDALRNREAHNQEVYNTIRLHPSFQPLIRVTNEVSQLQLAGALLDEVGRGVGERLVGKRYLCGGEIQYIDLQSGEEVHVPADALGQVSVTLSPPSFCVMHREAVMAGRKYDDYMVEEPHLEWLAATDHELDQIVCTSPYLKLSSTRTYRLDPAGTVKFLPAAPL